MGKKNRIFEQVKVLIKTGFFHVFGSSVVNKIIGFAGSIVLVRILSKQEYGVYTYADNIMSFFLLATGLGVVSGILQMCSETEDDSRRKLIYQYGCRIGLSFNMLLGFLVLVIAFCVKLPIQGSNICLAIMSFIPFVGLLSELQRTYLRSEFRNQEYAYANTFNTVIMFVFSCAFSFFFRAAGLVLAHYIAAISTAGLIIFRYKVPFSIRKVSIATSEKKQLVGISLISMLNNGLSRLMYLLDIFVLGIVIKDEMVIASYKIATMIPTAMAFIPESVIVYIYPYFARNRLNKQWVIQNYKRITLYLGIALFGISAMLVLFAPLIIRIVYGEQYLDALIPFRILSISFAVSGVFRTLAGNILVTQRKLKFNLFVAFFSSLLNTILNIILIQRWGSEGAAVATITTAIFTSILNVSYLTYVCKTIPDKQA